jgi:hypothetical protein
MSAALVYIVAALMLVSAGVGAYVTIVQEAWIETAFAVGLPIVSLIQWLRIRNQGEAERRASDELVWLLLFAIALYVSAIWPT